MYVVTAKHPVVKDFVGIYDTKSEAQDATNMLYENYATDIQAYLCIKDDDLSYPTEKQAEDFTQEGT